MFDRRNTSGHRILNTLKRLLTGGLLVTVAMLLAVGTGGNPFAQETDAVAPLVQKQPLPNRAARVEAEAALGKLFSRQFTTAKTPAQKAVLAGKLLDHGLRETDKPAQRCVALDLAR
ncbi:MAG: hypothetical protein HQ581_03435, partial [Planctomycetes bacterium]|nr:hypothetical protein [Planctomycetota bacterium]